MPQPYPEPAFNTTVGLVEHVNSLTDGLATVLLSICLFFVLFIMMNRQGQKLSVSMLVSFFLCFCLNALLWASGLLAGKYVLIYLLLVIASSIYVSFDRD